MTDDIPEPGPPEGRSRAVRILIAEPEGFHPKAVSILERVGEVQLEDIPLERGFAEYDVVWMRLARRVSAGVLGEKPRARILAIPATGLDHVDLEACAERGIRVISLKGETAFLDTVRGTAELTVGLAIALMRRIPQAAESVKAGVWNRDLFQGSELFEKVAGVVGVGRLGRIVGSILGAFGMEVIGCDPREDYEGVPLEEVLERSDLVTVHADLNPSSKNLIGKRQFAKMKSGAVFVNTSRGGVVDERALLEALRSGHLAGAALDVLATEPTVLETDPLIAYAREHDNLLIVPHIGGKTRESMEKTEIFIAERVVEAVS